MKFAAVIEYIADTAKVAEHRPAHRVYLTGLIESNRLAVAGPFLDDFGALIVYEAADAAEAEALLKADPFPRRRDLCALDHPPLEDGLR